MNQTINGITQPFGSIPNLRNLSRQASLTQALKLPLPAIDSICTSSSSSKRMFFFVLPDLSNGFLVLLSCIGMYQCVRVNYIGTYQYKVIKCVYLQKATPRSAANTVEASNQRPLIEVTIMADIQHTPACPKFTCLDVLATPEIIFQEVHHA
ncbi:hypothetical protein Xbud_03258 [Xenorhabdus budapestensis]|uniref:Uncharacterized protein n=1 Tax=Xenorhabdus budapestensis TaxID=290110 RepID=A0A2D0IRY2_XENBU|nr:hypothetical protein Xbud_03258 [Xenorhabdus budapestensis]